MKPRLPLAILLCACFFLAAQLHAQGSPPGGSHPPGGPPGSRPPNPPSGQPSGPPSGGNGPGSSSSGAAPKSQSVTSASGIKLGPPGRWWDDKALIQTIGISHDQQRKMDTIFDANRQAIIDTYKQLQKEQANMTAVSKQPQVDQARLFAAIDSVNQARAALEKANTQMLLQIRQQLAPTQVTKLDSLP